MEETIGYEALLPADEWDSLDIADWTDGDGFNPDGSPSGVTPIDGKGSAAQCQPVASEGCSSPSEDGPSAASPEGNCKEAEEPTVIDLGLAHEMTCRARELFDGTSEYVLECEICEEIGTADTYEEADAIAQLHRTFVAELAENWEQ